MHKWAWVMAVSLNYCTPLRLSLNFCNRFHRQKQENDEIKFWKSVPSYVLVRQYQWRKKIIFISSNKWENLKNVLFYRQQIAYIYLWFICYPWWSIDELENLHADRRTVCFEPWQKPRLGSRKTGFSPQEILLTVPRRCFCCGSYSFVIIFIMFACCMTLWPL